MCPAAEKRAITTFSVCPVNRGARSLRDDFKLVDNRTQKG
jgi:hypothetical protein